LQIVWKNVTKDDFTKEKSSKLVRIGQGGKRFLNIEDSSSITVEQIIEKSVDLFFPKEISKFGNKSDFKFYLEYEEGVNLNSFTDKNGKICSIDKWIDDLGLKRSQLRLYFLTEQKDEDSEIIELKEDSDGSVEQSSSSPVQKTWKM